MSDYDIKKLTQDGDFADGAVYDTKYNKITLAKKVTDQVAEHVGGKKPSAFISYTTIPSGATNPQGKPFGNVYLKIDLWVLQQTQGWQFYFLGCREGLERLSIEIKGTTGQTKQAFADIIRTKEVLIYKHVPGAAIMKIFHEDGTIFFRLSAIA